MGQISRRDVKRYGQSGVAEQVTACVSGVDVIFHRYVSTLGSKTVNVAYSWFLARDPNISGLTPCITSQTFQDYQKEVIAGMPWSRHS